jgi:hypothetical protein
MNRQRLQFLLDGHFDQRLSHEEHAEFEQCLLTSPEARDEFWKQAEFHALIRQCAQEGEGAREVQAKPRFQSRPRRSTVRRPVAVSRSPVTSIIRWAALFAMVILVVIWRLGPTKDSRKAVKPICTVTHDAGGRWAGRVQPTVGQPLSAGTYQLNSGLVELTFARGTKAALEGPAIFKIIDDDRLLVSSGTLGAHVPAEHRGFTVQTSAGNIIDLGTRFGIAASASGQVEVDVFDGKVEWKPAETLEAANQEVAGGSGLLIDPRAHSVSAIVSERDRFPQPTRTVQQLLGGGEFEPGTVIGTSGISGVPAVWGGDLCETTAAVEGIRPRQGTGMLRFLRPDSLPLDAPARTRNSEQFQCVDLRPFKELVARGAAKAETSAWFNQAPRGGSGSKRVVLTIASFRGNLKEVGSQWARRQETALSRDEDVLALDSDLTSWQRAEAKVPIPPDADYVVVSIRANIEVSPTGELDRLTANFVDSVSLQLTVPPQGRTAPRR